MVPDFVKVAGPFHVVKIANSKLDECRWLVKNEALGHRGHKTDPMGALWKPARLDRQEERPVRLADVEQ
jgi:hypothetical protein